MAKASRKRPGPAPMENVPERDEPDQIFAMTDPGDTDEVLEEVLTRHRGDTDSFVIVSRLIVREGQRREQWLFEAAPSPEIEQEIQRAYGEGDYRVKVYQRRVATDGVRRPLLVLNRVISIGPSRDPIAPPALAGVAPAAPAANDRIAELIAQMQVNTEKANDRMMQFMGQVVTAIAGGSKGMGMGELKTFAEAMGAFPKPAKEPNALELLGIALGMVEKVRGLAAPAAAVDPETGDVGGNALLLEGMRTFAQIFQAVKGPNGAAPGALAGIQPNTPPEMLAAPPGAVALPTTPPGAPIAEENEDMLMLKLFISRLCKAAAKNEPVEGYADQIERNLDEDTERMLRTDQWFELLSQFAPDVAPHRAWFARLREALLVLLSDDGDVPSQPAGEASGSIPK